MKQYTEVCTDSSCISSHFKISSMSVSNFKKISIVVPKVIVGPKFQHHSCSSNSESNFQVLNLQVQLQLQLLGLRLQVQSKSSTNCTRVRLESKPGLQSYNSVSRPLSHVHYFIPASNVTFSTIYIAQYSATVLGQYSIVFIMIIVFFRFTYTVLFDYRSCGILSLLNCQLSAADLSSISYNFKTSFTDATKANYRLLAIHFMPYEYTLNANSSRLKISSITVYRTKLKSGQPRTPF